MNSSILINFIREWTAYDRLLSNYHLLLYTTKLRIFIRIFSTFYHLRLHLKFLSIEQKENDVLNVIGFILNWIISICMVLNIFFMIFVALHGLLKDF